MLMRLGCVNEMKTGRPQFAFNRQETSAKLTIKSKSTNSRHKLKPADKYSRLIIFESISHPTLSFSPRNFAYLYSSLYSFSSFFLTAWYNYTKKKR